MNVRMVAYAVAVGAFLLVGWQWYARGQRIWELLEANARVTAERDQCRAEQAATDRAIADLRAAGEADRARRAEAERAAAQASTDAERRVQAALTARVPQECQDAVNWLGEYGRGLADEWGATK